jgi:hypothetical protein
MADKKISALTSASTPLAGTEVLPLVQSSTTVKVSAANITAGRAVSTLSVASLGPNGIPITMQEIAAAPSSATAAYVGVTTSAFPGGANGDLVLIPRSSSTNDVRILVGSGTPTDALVVQGSTKNILASAGNIVMSTAGKGIVDSTGTTSLQFTSLQVVSNKTIIAPSFTTAAGDTASTPTATPVTLFTPSGDGVWIVNALVTLTGAPAAYIASSMIKASGGVLAATAISTATNMSISVSGANVQATQTSGGNQVIAFSYIRLF